MEIKAKQEKYEYDKLQRMIKKEKKKKKIQRKEKNEKISTERGKWKVEKKIPKKSRK